MTTALFLFIEYLNDLGKTSGIDLLILTHNFDFYRTLKLRLGVNRTNCFIAQRDEEGTISVTEFKYQRDFFKNVVIDGIRDGNITNDDKKKLLISSVPFYRNLCEYSEIDTGATSRYAKLTCFLHLKTTPLDTQSTKISDLWNIVNPFLDGVVFSGVDENYYSVNCKCKLDTPGRMVARV